MQLDLAYGCVFVRQWPRRAAVRRATVEDVAHRAGGLDLVTRFGHCQGVFMTSFEGDAELVAAVQDADSVSWAVRAAAGRRLAAAAEVPKIAEVLQRLLLDAYDTGVVQETAKALLQRGDLWGLRAVLAALGRAEDSSVADQLAAEVDCDPRWLSGKSSGSEFFQQLEVLATDPDEILRAEAQQLLARLSAPEG